jgi:hypothetical protein
MTESNLGVAVIKGDSFHFFISNSTSLENIARQSHGIKSGKELV